MAESSGRGDGRGKFDEVVEKVAKEFPKLPNVRLLFGFLGRSVKTGSLRLYLTPELNDYVEFSKEDKVHSEALEREDFPLGGTLVWVKRSAKLERVRLEPGAAQGEFLRGDIASGALEELPLPEFADATTFLTPIFTVYAAIKQTPNCTPGTCACPSLTQGRVKGRPGTD